MTVTADVFDSSRWVKELEGATGVVSCVGAFGSNEFMERVCGDANIHAIKETAKAGEYFVMDLSIPGADVLVMYLTYRDQTMSYMTSTNLL